jgi:hypothetical protein
MVNRCSSCRQDYLASDQDPADILPTSLGAPVDRSTRAIRTTFGNRVWRRPWKCWAPASSIRLPSAQRLNRAQGW